ncbi:MAG: methyl-accepting chemotaxis protein [Deltaproteobacteria bacterium]|nr:methyl-accepting chemotaxis protein [Deltaproteobacteria bacterium]
MDRKGTDDGGGGRNRRKRYFIDRSLQGRFALRFLALGLLIAAGAGGSIWYLSSGELGRHLYRSHLPPVGPWGIVFPVLVRSLLVSIAVVLLFAVLAARSAFRKMEKEMRAFDDAIRRIGEGDLRTRIPEGRETNLNDTLGKVREALRERVATLRELQARMADEVGKTGAPEESVRREIRALCANLREIVRELPPLR